MARADEKTETTQPTPGSAADRGYGSPAHTTSEAQAAQPAPREAPAQPYVAFPKWKYHKDQPAIEVETVEAEEKLGEGWQDTPVVYGPEDTKGMKATDEALKKYTDAVYPAGWRDDGKRTDEEAVKAAKAARELRGIKDDDAASDGKKDQAAKEEQQRIEKDAAERDAEAKKADAAERKRLEDEQAARAKAREQERDASKKR